MPARRTSSARAKQTAAPRPQLSILLLLFAAHQRMAQVVDRELAANGVESDGYAMLSLIGVRQSVRLTQLAEELGLPLTTASDVVRRLEGRGLVRRRPNPDDGRSFLFELTARGDREWRRGWGALIRINTSLAERIDDDAVRDALTELGAALGAALLTEN